MPAEDTAPTSPAQATGVPATAPASVPPAFDPGALTKSLLEAMDARDQAAKERSAKASADPVAALTAERDQALATVAEREAKAAAEGEARAERKFMRREALRSAGCINPETALLIDPSLLKADDPAPGIEAMRKLHPYLFPAAPAPVTTGPTPRTMPAVSSPGQSAVSANYATAGAQLGLSPDRIAALSARVKSLPH